MFRNECTIEGDFHLALGCLRNSAFSTVGLSLFGYFRYLCVDEYCGVPDVMSTLVLLLSRPQGILPYPFCTKKCAIPEPRRLEGRRGSFARRRATSLSELKGLRRLCL